jgi:hypothetical protein
MGASSSGATADPTPTLASTRLLALACKRGGMVMAMVLPDVG